MTQNAVGLADIRARADIELLVSEFYQRVRADALLERIFQAQLGGDWAAHEARLCDFWETVLLGRKSFKTREVLGHVEVDSLCPLCPFHFERWCALFEATVDERFCGQCACKAKCRARAMSEALQRQLQDRRGCPFKSFN